MIAVQAQQRSVCFDVRMQNLWRKSGNVNLKILCDAMKQNTMDSPVEWLETLAVCRHACSCTRPLSCACPPPLCIRFVDDATPSLGNRLWCRQGRSCVSSKWWESHADWARWFYCKTRRRVDLRCGFHRTPTDLSGFCGCHCWQHFCRQWFCRAFPVWEFRVFHGPLRLWPAFCWYRNRCHISNRWSIPLPNMVWRHFPILWIRMSVASSMRAERTRAGCRHSSCHSDSWSILCASVRLCSALLRPAKWGRWSIWCRRGASVAADFLCASYFWWIFYAPTTIWEK